MREGVWRHCSRAALPAHGWRHPQYRALALSGRLCCLNYKRGKSDQHARVLDDIGAHFCHTVTDEQCFLFCAISYLDIDDIIFTTDSFRMADRFWAYLLKCT